MKTTFRKAVLGRELKQLMAFDQKVFREADCFDKSDWGRFESYWMLVDGIAVGCCAFEHHVDFQDGGQPNNPPLGRSLYIATTGILPPYQGKGFGRLLKSWQIAYARYHGFTRIVTNHRASNKKVIELNKAFGFRIIRQRKAIYYQDPPERTVV